MTTLRRAPWLPVLILMGLLVGLSSGCVALAPTPVPPSPTPTPAAGPQIVRRVDQGVDVPAKERRSIVVPVTTGQRVEGSFTVRGGLNIDFSVRDPFGNITSAADKVKGTRGFAFIAATSGNFDFIFDNAYEEVLPKSIDVSIKVWSQ